MSAHLVTSRMLIQYPSMKSLHSTIVERSFYGASVFAERHSRTISVPFRLSSVFIPLCLRDRVSEVSVNASLGSEDDLQLLYEPFYTPFSLRSVPSVSVLAPFRLERNANACTVERSFDDHRT